MPTTPIFAFPYPALTDAPNGAAQIQALAEAVETSLNTTNGNVTAVQTVTNLFATGVTVQNFQAALANFTSTSFTETFTTSNTPAAVAFVAPPSGKVLIHMRSWMDNNLTAGRTYLSFIIRNGGTIGSGTTFLAADDSRAVHNMSAEDNEYGATFFVSSLVAGNSYNVRNAGRVTSGTGESQNRELIVQPLWK